MNLGGKASLLLFAGFFTAASVFAAEDYKITIKDHRFDPAELTLPSNKKVKILVENQDPTAEEFESHDLNREKVIAGNGKATVFIGPLRPGTYKYFGDFNPKTAQGTIKAEE